MTDTKEVVTKQPILGNTAYDLAKDTATIYLPAGATFYAALAGIWGLPYSVQVVATVGALVVFLGVVLKISSTRFQALPTPTDGTLVVNVNGDPTTPDTYIASPIPAADALGKDTITLRVANVTKAVDDDDSPRHAAE